MLPERVAALSVRIYLVLLFLYPARFRREYGPMMAQLFQDLCREAYAQARLGGLVRLWGSVLKDLAASALAERLDIGWLARLARQPAKPLPWPAVLLAVLPGLAVLSARLGGQYRHLCLDLHLDLAACAYLRPVYDLAGPALDQGSTPPWFYVTLLCLLLVAGGLLLARRPAWAFPALGLLLAILPGFLLTLVFRSGTGSPGAGHTFGVNWLLPGLMWAVVLALVVYRRTDLGLPGTAWGLLALLMVANPFLILLPGVMLLLAIVIGLLLARQEGLLAGLPVVAAEFWLVDSIFDPDYGMLIWSYHFTAELVVSILPALFYLVISPMLVLRARSAWGRASGLLLPPLIGLVAAELIHHLAVQGATGLYSPGAWFVRGAGIIQYFLALAIFIYAQTVGTGWTNISREKRGAFASLNE